MSDWIFLAIAVVILGGLWWSMRLPRRPALKKKLRKAIRRSERK
jgi:hypothetical protein